jgi:DNA-binding NarL/FixJ family response regulator
MSIRIILADDHTILRDGLKRSFDQEDGIDVVGQAQDGLTAVDLARELSPDVMIMHSSDKYIREMFRAGASGYLLKNSPFDEVVDAVKAVFSGQTYISPAIGEMVIKEYTNKQIEDKSVFSVLSSREREVLQLLAEGNTTKQIGLSLHISPKTVEAHRLRIMNKLEIDNIAQLTKYAIQEGLTEA